MASTEAGHHEKRVYISQEGKLVVPSSAKIQMEPGAILSQYGASVTYCRTTTVGASLPNRGISIIETSQVSTHGIQAITPDVVGSRKTIIIDSSALITIRSSTVPNGQTPKFHSSGIAIHQSSDMGKILNKTRQVGAVIELLAYSTAAWYILSMPNSTAGIVGGYTLSSSTA